MPTTIENHKLDMNDFHKADLIIYVVDSSTEMDQNDENIIRMIRMQEQSGSKE